MFMVPEMTLKIRSSLKRNGVITIFRIPVVALVLAISRLIAKSFLTIILSRWRLESFTTFTMSSIVNNLYPLFNISGSFCKDNYLSVFCSYI